MNPDDAGDVRLPPGDVRELLAIVIALESAPVRFWEEAKGAGSLRETRSRLVRAGALDPSRRAESEAEAAREIERAASSRTKIVPFGAADFPAALARLPDPPPCLWVRGELSPEDERAVAVVGARRATPYGRSVARRLGREIAEAGVAVVSGLARGVDVEAHLGALDAGGATWAVLGSGLDAVYPREHEGVARRAAETGGAVVSEFPLRAGPRPYHFPRRNRVIAGLSAAVVVVEAREGSGSLITAEFAMEQGKEVGAVPGPALAPESAGTHALLRDGVALVERAIDVFRAVESPWAREAERRLEARLKPVGPGDLEGLSPEDRAVLAALGRAPADSDAVAAATGLPAAAVRAALARLEIQSLARAREGGLFERARPP